MHFASAKGMHCPSPRSKPKVFACLYHASIRFPSNFSSAFFRSMPQR